MSLSGYYKKAFGSGIVRHKRKGQKQAIIDCLKQGMSAKEIAEELGCMVQVVYRVRDELRGKKR